MHAEVKRFKASMKRMEIEDSIRSAMNDGIISTREFVTNNIVIPLLVIYLFYDSNTK